MTSKFSRKAIEALGYYVYIYLDPRNGRPFYIGKGKGNRVFSHLADESESEKTRVIRELKKRGLEPQIEILKYGLSEQEAHLVESTAIDLIGVQNLTNMFRGHGAGYRGRTAVESLIATLAAKPVTIRDPVMLININRLYHHGLSGSELYDTTRGIWRVGVRRDKARYALSVYQGIVREVYRIAGWFPAGSTMSRLSATPEQREDRWEFVGDIAEDPVRIRYKDRSVRAYLPKGAQNPIHYVNC
jgi:hypothetical protein